MNIETALRAYMKITAPVATPDDLRADVMRKEYAFERYILERAAELLARIEAGDRAREIVREVAQAYQKCSSYLDLGRDVTEIINKHSDWLDELPT